MSKDSRVLTSVLAATTLSAVCLASHKKASKFGVALHEKIITPDNLFNYSSKIIDTVSEKILSKNKE